MVHAITGAESTQTVRSINFSAHRMHPPSATKNVSIWIASVGLECLGARFLCTELAEPQTKLASEAESCVKMTRRAQRLG